MSNNLCSQCHLRSRWFDHRYQRYSPFCSNTCKITAMRQNNYTPQPAIQGQPLCQICDNAAFYDGYRFAPGCCKKHTFAAKANGLTIPR